MKFNWRIHGEVYGYDYEFPHDWCKLCDYIRYVTFEEWERYCYDMIMNPKIKQFEYWGSDNQDRDVYHYYTSTIEGQEREVFLYVKNEEEMVHGLL